MASGAWAFVMDAKHVGIGIGLRDATEFVKPKGGANVSLESWP